MAFAAVVPTSEIIADTLRYLGFSTAELTEAAASNGWPVDVP